MIAAFFRAFGDLFAPHQRRALLLSLLAALALLFLLWLAATAALQLIHVTGLDWLDRLLGALGSIGALFLAWLLFPAMSAAATGLWLDGIAAAVERRHYPDLPPPRRQSVGEILRISLRLALLALVVNMIALPFYFWPALNLVVYYALNGYLVGRGYFALVALRRLDIAVANALWRHYRWRFFTAGLVIAVPLSLPVVNLLAPIWGTAFMLHIVEGLRARATPNGGYARGIGPRRRV
jgi:CysZ protein